MDAEIQFGEMEHAEPEVRLRPDHNKHYAVAAYATPDDRDLPIFVDMDVMREMEAHALSDTSVELGGVMLGGQYEDEDGQPFVIVTDSLRAQHFEATKGSFKFTHETWQQISRERDEFPEDLQMVGWYHTHPDWGVFLSGMDMFICDNFFNKPLDLALVIDPCRGDRGMFQWTPDERSGIRRTNGFYLIASRFRQYDLEIYACQLEGRITMASDPRYGGVAGQIGPTPPPVVNISENRGGFQSLAVMSMLMMQFLLVCLIAWRIMAPASKEEDKKAADKAKPFAALEEKIDALARADAAKRDAALESQIQTRVLNRIVTQLSKSPNDLVYQVQEQERELALRDAEHRDDVAYRQLLVLEKVKLDSDVKELQKQLAAKKNDYEELRKSYKQKSEEATKKTTEVAELKKQIASLKKGDGSKEAGEDDGGWSPISIGIAVAIAFVLLIAGAGFTILMRRQEDEEIMAEESDGGQTSKPAEPSEQADFTITDGQSSESDDEETTPIDPQQP